MKNVKKKRLDIFFQLLGKKHVLITIDDKWKELSSIDIFKTLVTHLVEMDFTADRNTHPTI